MLRWLFNKVFGCLRACEWETLNRVPVLMEEGGMPYAFDYELRCKVCGEIKVKRV